MIITITMTWRNSKMTQMLRMALNNADSVRATAKAAALSHAALVRFKSGQQSLRMDLSNQLTAHFQIECRRVRRRGKGDQ